MSCDPPPAWLERLAAAVQEPAAGAAFGAFSPPANGARHSAVLVLFGAGEQGPDVLLTQRASTLRSHAGQVAFPGGRVDPDDADPAETALREAYEEAGVQPSGVVVLAECPELFLRVTNFRVTPVIGWWRDPCAVAPGDPAEVERVVRVPLAELLDPAHRFTAVFRDHRSGPAFQTSGLFIWGFTAAVLSWLLRLAGLEQPWDETLVVPVPEQQVRIAARQELRRDLSEQQGLAMTDMVGRGEVDVP